jgi:phosphoglycolate phosphatase
MKTALAAGMFAVGVLWGFRDEAELHRDGAQFLVKRPAEILGLLDQGRASI